MPDDPTREKRLALAVLPVLGAGLIRILRRTLRIRYANRQVVNDLVARDRRYILTFWHGRLLLMHYAYPGPRISVLVSRHRDGELIARTMARLGHHSTRGSTTRGGTAALRQAVRLIRTGWDIAFTPDGPRGPARVVQAGVIQAARLSGAPILPVTFAASRARRLRSWDSFLVPRPFSRSLIAYGTPIIVPRDLDRPGLEAKRREVEEALNHLTDWADRAVGVAGGT